jgi:hypothetical protein
MASNLLRKAAGKDSMRGRRKAAGWDDDFLASLLIDPARAVLESGWWLPISWRWNIGTCGA